MWPIMEAGKPASNTTLEAVSKAPIGVSLAERTISAFF
jgi:hypothetical protein